MFKNKNSFKFSIQTFQANVKATASARPTRLATTSSAETLASTPAVKVPNAKPEIMVCICSFKCSVEKLLLFKSTVE